MTTVVLRGWGRSTRSRSVLRRVMSDDEIAAAVTGAGPRGVIARGLGRAYGDAAGNHGGTVLDLTGRDRILGFDTGTGVITVESGLSLGGLLAATVPAGWLVPALPGTRHVTVGGAIAADVHGKDHHDGGGSLAAHLLSIDLLTADGSVRTVGPDRDPRLFWATTGGMGLTGVVLRATLRLRRIRTGYLWTRTERVTSLDAVLARLRVPGYAVAWLNPTGRHAGAGVVHRAWHAERDAPLVYRPGRAPVVPPLPGLVHRWSAAAVNAVWLRRAPARPVVRLEPFTTFFHPLDAVRRWNRVYGSGGFVQYQFAVPTGAADVIARALRAVADARLPCLLPVLKAFGPAAAGPLSFPMPGWTLSVDLPVTAGLAPVLAHLDDLVCAAGGRIYLAKDARTRAGVLAAMYPRLAEFRALRRELDPTRILVSDLARRLDL